MESNIEDFIAPKDGTIFVSTIHKAKGTEFDTVHLLLSNCGEKDPDKLRAIYVGITRAQHALYIYNDTSFLTTLSSIALPLSMHDVWLDFFKSRKQQVLNLRSGEKLEYSNGYLVSKHAGYVAALSKSMKKRIEDLELKGYTVTDAEVSYVIAWRPPEEKQEIYVCLANLLLERTDTERIG